MAELDKVLDPGRIQLILLSHFLPIKNTAEARGWHLHFGSMWYAAESNELKMDADLATLKKNNGGKVPVPKEEWWKKDHDCVYCNRKHPWCECCNPKKDEEPMRRLAYDELYGKGKTENHEGKLELMTWDFFDRRISDGRGGEGIHLGFGAGTKEKLFPSKPTEDDIKNIYAHFEENDERLATARDNCFRWTCCGATVGCGTRGCDHHGGGQGMPLPLKPCSCDWCWAGEGDGGDHKLPDAVLKIGTQENRHLMLRRIVDPRSKTAAGFANLEQAKLCSTSMEANQQAIKLYQRKIAKAIMRGVKQAEGFNPSYSRWEAAAVGMARNLSSQPR